MELPRWENLPEDCLAQVFGRVGIESLLLDVPFVCKSWYRTTLNSSCWEFLDFSKFVFFQIGLFPEKCGFGEYYSSNVVDRFMAEYKIGRFSVESLVKLVIQRSQGKCSFLSLPVMDCPEMVLNYVYDNCPAMRELSFFITGKLNIILLIEKLKFLEFLSVPKSEILKELIPKIGLNCKNFKGLSSYCSEIGKEEALAIVTNLPKIEFLSLRASIINEENILTILEGCKGLKHFDVSYCIGFEINEKILKLASHIHHFDYVGSCLTLSEDFGDDDDDDEMFN